MNYLAASQPIGGEFKGIGPLGRPGDNAPQLFSNVLSTIIGFLTIVAALWFIFLVITAGYGMMSSGGDKQKFADARSKLTTGVIGLGFVVLAVILVRLVARLLGIDDVLDPMKAIPLLSPN
ncbi:hypothetical protein HYZ78_01935 [Candidatus Microgenomates bacterium]|nr:hypothetical protein [Candidatus Microgenomates bacterium]